MIARAQHIHSVSSLLLWSVCIKSTIKAVAKLRTLNYYARCWIALSGLCVEDSPAALEWIDIFSASRNSNFIIITARHATRQIMLANSIVWTLAKANKNFIFDDPKLMFM